MIRDDTWRLTSSRTSGSHHIHGSLLNINLPIRERFGKSIPESNVVAFSALMRETFLDQSIPFKYVLHVPAE